MQKKLADYRREAGFSTQEELAVVVGVERNTVSRWETGEREPRVEVIRELARILRITGDEVLSAIAASKRDSA